MDLLLMVIRGITEYSEISGFSVGDNEAYDFNVARQPIPGPEN
jgi:hypothetical protein